jgi:hypothetical protein|tara:strand:+ start:22 stop:459 length:438 start_codon:yes stop_codon:yes gene_type:complete
MNVIDASIRLYGWFQENDSFSLDKDFQPLMSIVEDPERDKAALLCALESLEKYEIISSCMISTTENKKEKEEKYWTVNRPLESMSQNIEVDYSLALLISELINNFAQKIEKKDAYCNPSEIKPENIRDLTFIASFLMGDEEDEKK